GDVDISGARTWMSEQERGARDLVSRIESSRIRDRSCGDHVAGYKINRIDVPSNLPGGRRIDTRRRHESGGVSTGVIHYGCGDDAVEGQSIDTRKAIGIVHKGTAGQAAAMAGRGGEIDGRPE